MVGVGLDVAVGVADGEGGGVVGSGGGEVSVGLGAGSVTVGEGVGSVGLGEGDSCANAADADIASSASPIRSAQKVKENLMRLASTCNRRHFPGRWMDDH